MPENRVWRVIEASAIVLFTFQALRVLLSMLFALVYDAIFDGEGLAFLGFAGGLCLVMLCMPLLSPRQPAKISRSLRTAAILCALARVPLSIDWPWLRLIAAILVIAFANLYMAGLLGLRARTLVPALSLGLFADQFLRALGHTYDLGLRAWWWPIQIALSFGVVVFAIRLARSEDIAADTPEADSADFAAGLSYGAALFLLSSLFGLPNAAARWTGSSYTIMVASLMALTMFPLWPHLTRWLRAGKLLAAFWFRAALALLLLGGLVLADRSASVISALALLIAAAAFWSSLVLRSGLSTHARGTRLGLVAGMAAFVLLGVCHAFSYTYAYTVAEFQGAGLPTFLVAALLVVGPALLPRRTQGETWTPLLAGGARRWLAGGFACWLVALLVAIPWPPRLRPGTDAVRLGTYNVHYGFDTYWHLSPEAQARTIEESDADVVALQEVDTGRLTSFGIDDALWLARRLGMQAVYLPTVEHTTGIAVLSRLQISESEGRLLPSLEEPTGIIRVTVNVGGAPLRAHGTWLGLSTEERARQLKAALEFIGEGRATLAGDLNSTPDSPVYAAMLAQGFLDPFIAGGFPPDPTDPAVSPQKRIDFVWLRGLQPTAARVLDSLASDHRMVVVEAH
jgi:endonuclease/exonuclease/phosphatase family metal-dependent hydrolase